MAFAAVRIQVQARLHRALQVGSKETIPHTRHRRSFFRTPISQSVNRTDGATHPGRPWPYWNTHSLEWNWARSARFGRNVVPHP